MSEGSREHSFSGSEEESALTGSKRQRAGAYDMQEDPDELMLSEFLISLHSSAGYHADMVQTSYSTAAVTGAAGPRGAVHGKAAGRAAAPRRTVVHRRKRRDDLAGPCNHCGALTSPQWRKGPKGKPVLCNACGIRFLRNRTLTKVMPKKRRHGGAGGKRNRAAAAAATAEEDGDAMLGLDDDMAAADEDYEETYSTAAELGAGYDTQTAAAFAALSREQQLKQMLVTDAYGAPEDTVSQPLLAGRTHQNVPDIFTGTLAPLSSSAYTASPVVGAGSQTHRFGSHSSSSSSKSLLDHLGDCPSLTLALALHQQQQRKQQEEAARHCEDVTHQQLSCKYSLPSVPELKLCSSPHSAPGDSSGTALTGSPLRPALLTGAGAAAVAATGSGSPVSSSSSMLQLQQYSSSSPPLSPLFVQAVGPTAATGDKALPSLLLPGAATTQAAGVTSPGISGNSACMSAGAAGVAGRECPKPADILQLVQQLGSALGGVGPAIDFLKLCSGNPAAVAAAVAAVAASAAVTAAV